MLIYLNLVSCFGIMHEEIVNEESGRLLHWFRALGLCRFAFLGSCMKIVNKDSFFLALDWAGGLLALELCRRIVIL